MHNASLYCVCHTVQTCLCITTKTGEENNLQITGSNLLLTCVFSCCKTPDIWCLHNWFTELKRMMIQTNLDKRGAAKEETKHVGHNVITDHTGNWHNEPIQTQESSHQSL